MSKLITHKLEDLISNNKEIFRQELKQVIMPSFTGLEEPNKYRNILINTIEQAKRSSLLKQAEVVAEATEFLEHKKNKSLIISAEIGTGKTDMAVKISLSKKLCPVYMIVCPPHLVDTWTEELAINYRNPKAYKVIRVKRYEDIAPYAKRNLWADGVKYYFIITRENLKLSYPKEIAINIKRRYITTEKELDGQTVMLQQLIKVAKCPECDLTLKEGTENHIDLDKIPRKCECGCALRQSDRSKSKNLRTREAVADYIFKNFTKGSYNVILDEMHEYKGGDTGQGNAIGRLVANARKTIGLTGTLMNGYASSLFYLLYRLNPRLMKNELGFDYNQVKNFVSAYGAHEEIVDVKEVSHEGIVTRMGARISLKEKPKVSPHMLSILMGMTIFLKLEEIKMPNNLQLPPYEEIVDLVEMEEELKAPYISYLQEVTKKIRTDKRLLGNLATDAIAIPDMPFTPRSAQDVCFYEPTTTREDFGLTNKEKRLIENVGNELEQGRDCLVYITFSNQKVATDLLEILSNAFPNKKVLFLPSTVPAAKRKEWIKNHPSDVLICNPELVKTGLTLLNFVTIIFYETTYNVFTLKQASRRSWRIGQTEDIKVIFMAYADTPQHKALELIGAKIGAANSLEGKFSDEGDLSSMGDDDDNIQLALARSIIGGDTASRDIKMTSITNFGGDRDWNSFELYYESLLNELSEQRTMQEELIEAATKNEEDGISIHDGHGGTNLANIFNVTPGVEFKEEVVDAEILTNDSNYGFKEGDIVSIYDESSIFKTSPGNAQLYVDLPSGRKVFLNNYTAPKFSFSEESEITLPISLKNMINTFAEKLLEHHNSGDLYGGIESTSIGKNGKESVVTSTVGAYQLFEMNDSYKNGELFGLAVIYDRYDDNQIAYIKVDKVYNDGDVPFQTECKAMGFSVNVLKYIMEESNSNVAGLTKVLTTHFQASSVTEKSLKRVVKKSETKDESEDTQSLFYYVGKSKKQKKIEVKASNNLFDVIPDADMVSGGVQLAFAF
ncbi:helicase-related protein [Sulfurimonas sp.]|uniref:helicase-related protein n=1 Tax=Sulfurimonas sp. TaxID=2022749 RepID=UPI0025FB43EC|nr:helicase-related protein [Sulfurimonas sp.]